MNHLYEIDSVNELKQALGRIPSECSDFKVEVHVGSKFATTRRSLSKTIDIDLGREIVTLYV